MLIMWAKQKRQSGFTIVELLIVIVVIGILAAITIVSYNGVTAKANYQAANSLATTISKKIELFRANYGQLPTLDELQNNKAAGSTVVGSGPPEAKVDSTSVGSGEPTPTTGTKYVRFYSSGCGNTFVDYWDYTNNRLTSASTTPQSKTFTC
jgi:type IV pilus assembly protein PilA